MPYVSLYWEEPNLGYWKFVRNLTPPFGLYNNSKYYEVWLAR